MCDGALPRITWEYNYGIDVLFYALREISYHDSPFDSGVAQTFVKCSPLLQVILKGSPLECALSDILCLPQGESLVKILTHYCSLPRKDVNMFEPICNHYVEKEKEKLFFLDKVTQKKWPEKPFEVYILSKEAGKSFSVGRTSSLFERTFFIPFHKEKAFVNSLTHELIHFKINNIFEEDSFTSSYQRVIAQEVAVRLVDMYVNRAIKRSENIFFKKVEMAALGHLPLFLSCLNDTKGFMEGSLSPDDMRRIGSIIEQKCNSLQQKDITLSITRLLLEKPQLIRSLFFGTIKQIIHFG